MSTHDCSPTYRSRSASGQYQSFSEVVRCGGASLRVAEPQFCRRRSRDLRSNSPHSRYDTYVLYIVQECFVRRPSCCTGQDRRSNATRAIETARVHCTLKREVFSNREFTSPHVGAASRQPGVPLWLLEKKSPSVSVFVFTVIYFCIHVFSTENRKYHVDLHIRCKRSRWHRRTELLLRTVQRRPLYRHAKPIDSRRRRAVEEPSRPPPLCIPPFPSCCACSSPHLLALLSGSVLHQACGGTPSTRPTS